MSAVTLQQAFDLAIQHHQAGRPAEAEAIYRQILSIQPGNAAALANLGEAYFAMGRIEEAIASYQRALELKPELAEAHVSLGNALRERGQLDEAIAAYRRACEGRPGYAEAWSNLGNALKERGELEEAVAAYRRALEFRPDLAIIWNNLAGALWEQKKFAAAGMACRRAIELEPNLSEAHHGLGNALWERGEVEAAVAAYRHALQLRPNYAEAHNNLGVALTEFGRLEEAMAECREALRLKVPYPAAHNNLGNALVEQRRLDEAGVEYRRALAVDPDYAEAKFGQALLALLRGDFEQGWPLYESRWEAWGIARRDFGQPVWDGGPLDGRRVLVHAEQGFGDAIQFIRYAPLIAARGGEVVVECPRALVDLFRGAKGVREVVVSGDLLPPFDWQVPMLSLPLVFQTMLEGIPREVPYLSAEAGRRDVWRERLGAGRELLRVGLAWEGSAHHHRRRIRNLGLEKLLPLWRVEGVEFHSLQVGDGPKPLPQGPGGRAIVDHTKHLADFAETAALVAELDLIISVDTAVAHLAGALGQPVWTLLSFVPDWRWGVEGGETPWYSSMRLFRQPTLGDWDSVIDRVAEELAASPRQRGEVLSA